MRGLAILYTALRCSIDWRQKSIAHNLTLKVRLRAFLERRHTELDIFPLPCVPLKFLLLIDHLIISDVEIGFDRCLVRLFFKEPLTHSLRPLFLGLLFFNAFICLFMNRGWNFFGLNILVGCDHVVLCLARAEQLRDVPCVLFKAVFKCSDRLVSEEKFGRVT